VEQRWVAQLANFQFDIKYRPGVANRNADVLSRVPQEEEVGVNQTTIDPPESRAPQLDGEEWQERQPEDPALRQVCEWLQQGRRPTAEEKSVAPSLARRLVRDWNQLHLDSGVLQREVMERHTGERLRQIVVPATGTRTFWQQYHKATGHMSAARTGATLRQGFFWPKLGEDIREWAASCPQCAQSKTRPEVRAPLIPIIPT